MVFLAISIYHKHMKIIIEECLNQAKDTLYSHLAVKGNISPIDRGRIDKNEDF